MNFCNQTVRFVHITIIYVYTTIDYKNICVTLSYFWYLQETQSFAILFIARYTYILEVIKHITFQMSFFFVIKSSFSKNLTVQTHRQGLLMPFNTRPGKTLNERFPSVYSRKRKDLWKKGYRNNTSLEILTLLKEKNLFIIYDTTYILQKELL